MIYLMDFMTVFSCIGDPYMRLDLQDLIANPMVCI